MKVTSPALRRRAVCAAIAIAATSGLAPVAQAQDWPAKPVRIVVGGPAGGTADTLARLVAEGLSPSLGKPVIVENKPGAAGVLAVNELVSSPHDGHTLLLIQGGIVSETPQAYKVRFDPNKDLKPLVQLSRQGLILVGNPDLPAKTLPELTAWIKAQGKSVDYASYATGMRAHTAGVQFARQAKLSLSHVGYKGSPPALQDVMGGHVPLMFDGPSTSLPLIKAGKLRAYAVVFPTRLAALPDVPTFAEAGYPALNEVGWMGLWSTPDVPAKVQSKVRELALAYMAKPEVQKRLTELGMESGQPLTSEQLSKGLNSAAEQHAAVLHSIGYKPE